MKAVLVIDMPNDCYDCPCYYEERNKCEVTFENIEDDIERPSWCPLKPLPHKKDIDKTLEFGGYENIIQESLARGYNTYHDEITGESNG